MNEAAPGKGDWPASFEIGEWHVDRASGSLSRAGESTRLEPRVMDVLGFLASRPGEVASKGEIIEAVWGDTFVGEAALSRCISELRRALGDDARAPRYIETLPKRGYRLLVSVESAGKSAPISPPASESESPSRSEAHVRATAPPMPSAIPAPPRPATTRWRNLLNYAAATTLVVVLFASWWASRPLPDGDLLVGSLAVLPLRALSQEPAAQFLAEGLTAQLSTELARIEGLAVVSGISARNVRETDGSLREIAASLGVDAIVEGSVQMSGDRLVISLELIDARADTHLWAGSYQEVGEDPLAVELEVAGQAVREIELALAGEREPAAVRTASSEVERMLSRGRVLAERGNPADTLRAIEHYRQAIDLDPGYAPPHAALADALATLAWNLWSEPERGYAEARAAAHAALDLDPRLAAAHAVLATIAAEANWDWPEADRFFRTAVDLDPDSAFVRERYSRYLRRRGRVADALGQTRRALELDPDSPSVQAGHAWNRMLAGDLDAAGSGFLSVLELDNDFARAHEGLCAVYSLQERHGEAIGACRRAAGLPGREDLQGALGYALARGGDKEAAGRLLAELGRQWRDQPEAASTLATIELGLGEVDAALATLEAAVRVRALRVAAVLDDPFLRQLASTPRFQALLDAMDIDREDG